MIYELAGFWIIYFCAAVAGLLNGGGGEGGGGSGSGGGGGGWPERRSAGRREPYRDCGSFSGARFVDMNTSLLL